MSESAAPVRFLRLPEVLEITSLGESTLPKLEAAGHFPRRRQLGPRAVGWRSDEVSEWLESRPEVVVEELEPEPA